MCLDGLFYLNISTRQHSPAFALLADLPRDAFALFPEVLDSQDWPCQGLVLSTVGGKEATSILARSQKPRLIFCVCSLGIRPAAICLPWSQHLSLCSKNLVTLSFYWCLNPFTPLGREGRFGINRITSHIYWGGLEGIPGKPGFHHVYHSAPQNCKEDQIHT